MPVLNTLTTLLARKRKKPGEHLWAAGGAGSVASSAVLEVQWVAGWVASQCITGGGYPAGVPRGVSGHRALVPHGTLLRENSEKH